jgi:hypothetical protein
MSAFVPSEEFATEEEEIAEGLYRRFKKLSPGMMPKKLEAWADGDGPVPNRTALSNMSSLLDAVVSASTPKPMDYPGIGGPPLPPRKRQRDAVDFTSSKRQTIPSVEYRPPVPSRAGKRGKGRMVVPGVNYRYSNRASTRGQPLALGGTNEMAYSIAGTLAREADALAAERINGGSGFKMSSRVYGKGQSRHFGIGHFKANLSRNLRMNYKAKLIEARAARMVYNKVKNQLYGRSISQAIQTKLANGKIRNAGRHKLRGRRI